MSLIHNEQTKFRATFANGVAIAILAVGGLAPIFGRLNTSSETPVWIVATSSISCLLAAGAIHYWVIRYLKRLKE